MQELVKMGIFAIGFANLAMPAMAVGSLPNLTNHAVVSQDGTRVLVMVSPPPEQDLSIRHSFQLVDVVEDAAGDADG